MKSKSLSSSLFTTLGIVVPIAAAGFGNACTSDFEGCAASRSCGAAAGEAGDGGSDATGGKAGAGGKGAGGSAGRAVETGGEGGDASGGKGGTSGSGTGATGGSDAGQGGGDDEGGSPGTGGSAGMSGAGGTAGSAGTGGVLDTTPPTIILKRLTRLIAPSATRDETDLEGAVGVAADTNLVLTFSEPMDRVTTQAAFQSADIPDVTFTWSGDDTVLTITPNVDLAYAMGDITVSPVDHTISLTDTAEDQAGNRMASTWTGTFNTARHVSQTLTAAGDEAVRHIRGNNNDNCGSNPWVGDSSSNEAACVAIQFDLSLIPAGIVSFLRSTASGEFVSREGSAYSHLGEVHFYEFDAIPLSTAAWATMPIVDRGVFAYNDRQYPSIDLLASMPDAYATQGTNGTLLQYRVSFPIQTNSDEALQLVEFACTYDLELEYLIP